MQDSVMTLIGIFLALILMFIFPFMELIGKNDEISETAIELASAEFVNQVAKKGQITEFDYSSFIQKINSTSNSYDVQIELKILDDTSSRLTTVLDSTLQGDNKYYSVFTKDILDKIYSVDSDSYKLKPNDYIIVTVKNTNVTIGTQARNFLYSLFGKNSHIIETTASAQIIGSSQY